MLQTVTIPPGVEDSLPHLSGPAAAVRQVLAAHFVRDCEHVVEIGGHIRPVTDYLTHAPRSVLSVDPKTPAYEADHTAWPALPCAPCAEKIPGGRLRLRAAQLWFGSAGLFAEAVRAARAARPVAVFADRQRQGRGHRIPAGAGAGHLAGAGDRQPAIAEGALPLRRSTSATRRSPIRLTRGAASPCFIQATERARPHGAQPRSLHLDAYLAAAALDRRHRRSVDDPLLHVVRPAETDRQRTDPGRRFRERRRHPALHAPRLRSAAHRPCRVFRRHRTRPPADIVRAEHRVPAAGHHQRPLQILHQHLQGPPRRADAAAHPLPACRSGAALSRQPLQAGEIGRSGDHGEGRGGAAGRLHRRRLRAAGHAGRPGAHRHDVHHGAEFLARARSRWASCWCRSC